LRRRESFVSATDTRNLFRFHETRSGPLLGFLFGLAPDGVFRAASLALRAVRSYRTFSPSPAGLRRQAVCFLWHFPSESLETFRLRVSQPNKPGLRSIAPCGVRTFLPRLAPGAILHPSKTRESITEVQKISSLSVRGIWLGAHNKVTCGQRGRSAPVLGRSNVQLARTRHGFSTGSFFAVTSVFHHVAAPGDGRAPATGVRRF